MKRKAKIKGDRVPAKYAPRLDENLERGEVLERARGGSSREAGRSLGFEDLPGGQVEETGRDEDNGELFTDTNPMTNAATVAGAFGSIPKGKPAYGSDPATDDLNNTLDTDTVKTLGPSEAEDNGMTDIPDEETVRRYVTGGGDITGAEYAAMVADREEPTDEELDEEERRTRREAERIRKRREYPAQKNDPHHGGPAVEPPP